MGKTVHTWAKYCEEKVIWEGILYISKVLVSVCMSTTAVGLIYEILHGIELAPTLFFIKKTENFVSQLFIDLAHFHQIYAPLYQA